MKPSTLDFFDPTLGLDVAGEAKLGLLPPDRDEIASQNQRDLDRAGILMARVTGPPGAGKTALIAATAKRLAGKLRVAVVVVNPAPDRDVEELLPVCFHVEAIEAAVLEPADLRVALAHTPVADAEIVIVETCGGIATFPHAGEHLVVAALGVSGGDDKAAEYKSLVSRASLVLMCKTDLKPYVRFNSQLFHADVRRLNSAAPVIELSAASGEGMKEWTRWLEAQANARRSASQRAQNEPEPEWFFG